MMKLKYVYKQQLPKYLRVCMGIALLAIPAAIGFAQGPPKPPPGPPPAGNQTLEFDFSSPVQIGPADAPGVWYPDRHAPCGFKSPETAPDGTKNTLEEDICSGDVQVDSFSNTQGRKYDLLANAYSVSIDLYVPSAWATESARKAGFWATAFDSSNNVGDFPIIEFQGPITSPPAVGPSYQPNGGVPGFYGWDNTTGSFTLIGLPDGFKYDTWVELTMTLIPSHGFVYTVSDPKGHHGKSIMSPLSDSGDAGIGNAFMQGYNYGNNYSIFWDNLGYSFTSPSCVAGKKP